MTLDDFKSHILKYAPLDEDKSYMEYTTWLGDKLVEESRELEYQSDKHNCITNFKNNNDLVEEMGDCLYMLIGLMEAHNITVDEVIEFNVKKLQKRFPKGHWDKDDAERKVDHD